MSKETPIIKKVQPLSLYQRRNNGERKEKTNVLTLNKYMPIGPNGARCQEWPCWLVASSKLLLCSALIYFCHPCGGGVEYLHRDPASRRRRRKGKFQVWDSKIWSRVPRDSDTRKPTLARTSSIYKRQSRPLVREGDPQKQYCNCQTVIIFGHKPQVGLDTKTYWLNVSRNVTLTLTK
jgi:hypothetical protein